VESVVTNQSSGEYDEIRVNRNIDSFKKSVEELEVRISRWDENNPNVVILMTDGTVDQYFLSPSGWQDFLNRNKHFRVYYSKNITMLVSDFSMISHDLDCIITSVYYDQSYEEMVKDFLSGKEKQHVFVTIDKCNMVVKKPEFLHFVAQSREQPLIKNKNYQTAWAKDLGPNGKYDPNFRSKSVKFLKNYEVGVESKRHFKIVRKRLEMKSLEETRNGFRILNNVLYDLGLFLSDKEKERKT